MISCALIVNNLGWVCTLHLVSLRMRQSALWVGLLKPFPHRNADSYAKRDALSRGGLFEGFQFPIVDPH